MAKVFYGWWVVTFSSIIALWTGVLFYGFTAFVGPLVHDLGWSYFQISLAASIRSCEFGILAPMAGYFADRWGVRPVILWGGLVCGAGLIFLSRVETLAMFYLGFVVLSIGFSGLGQAVVVTGIAHWFRQHLGKAVGITIAGYGASGLVVPLIVYLVAESGWRMGLLITGLLTWLIVLPSSWVIKSHPEACGLSADGIAPSPAGRRGEGAAGPGGEELNVSARAAIKTSTFWLFTYSLTTWYMVLNVLSVHSLPYLNQRQVPLSTAVMIIMFIPIASIPGRIVLGWASDRWGAKWVYVAAMAAQVLGFYMFATATAIWMYATFILLFGMGFGGAFSIRARYVQTHFGSKSFGAIQGVMVSVMTLGALIGPALAGWLNDIDGSYVFAWKLMLGVMVSGLLASLFLAQPKV